MTICTAVIGYGYSAKTFHLPFIRVLPEFELVAISSSQVDAVKQDCPEAHYYSNATQLLQESDAELVIITAPNDVHFELARCALEQNKHVIIEKPFVTRLEDGQALLRLAQEKQRVLSLFHNRRWDGDFLTLKQLINEGRLGEIKLFESHFDRYRPEVRQRWREQAQDGGGLLFDLAPHLLDQALVLFGLPHSITAQCEQLRPQSSTIDYFNLILDYPSYKVHLHANVYSPEPNIRFSVLGTKAKYVKYGLDTQESDLKQGRKPLGDAWSQEEVSQYGRLYSETEQQVIPTLAGAYQQYFREVAGAIRQGKKNPVSAQEALMGLYLIELALQSNQEGRRLKVDPSKVKWCY